MPYGSGMSMHQSCSWEHLHIPMYQKVSFDYLLQNGYLMVHTCNIFAMHLQTFTKAYLTSWEMVSADGIWYSGCPVFIRLWKPWSVMILKGRLFSDTQQTISALWAYRIRWKIGDSGVYLTWIRLMYADSANRWPYLFQYIQTWP